MLPKALIIKGKIPGGTVLSFSVYVGESPGSCAQNPPVTSFSGSPFRVPVKDVVDPSKVKIAGPGLGSGVRARILQSFTVDSSKAGLAPLEVRVMGPRGEYILLMLPSLERESHDPGLYL